jgi:hypothetical protein
MDQLEMVRDMFEGAMKIDCVMRDGIIKSVILNALCLSLELSRQCVCGIGPLVAMITSTAMAIVIASAGWGMGMALSFLLFHVLTHATWFSFRSQGQRRKR